MVRGGEKWIGCFKTISKYDKNIKRKCEIFKIENWENILLDSNILFIYKREKIKIHEVTVKN